MIYNRSIILLMLFIGVTACDVAPLGNTSGTIDSVNAPAGKEKVYPRQKFLTDLKLDKVAASIALKDQSKPMSEDDVSRLLELYYRGSSYAAYLLWTYNSIDGKHNEAENWWNRCIARGEPNCVYIDLTRLFQRLRKTDRSKIDLSIINEIDHGFSYLLSIDGYQYGPERKFIKESHKEFREKFGQYLKG